MGVPISNIKFLKNIKEDSKSSIGLCFQCHGNGASENTFGQKVAK